MTVSSSRSVLACCLLLAASGWAANPPLRVSMIPSTDPSGMLRDAKPFVAYHAAVVEAMARGQVDLGHFGGFTFVQANRHAGAIPLVQRARDRRFRSKFIT